MQPANCKPTLIIYIYCCMSFLIACNVECMSSGTYTEPFELCHKL